MIMKLLKFIKFLRKNPIFLLFNVALVALAILYANEKNKKCDCPVCKECECDVKKKVTFAEKTELIDTSQPMGPIA